VTLRAAIVATVVLTGLAAGAARAGGLVDYQVEDGAIPHPLTDQPGVPERGTFILPPPFFDPAEVEAAMMRGNAEVVPHRAVGGISKVCAHSPADRRGACL
jgi:hypothetical protein